MTNPHPTIICRVRALYPFHSKEKSSLCFEKNDSIDVLTQLDSGWWDGWCNGARGWFPSNYVEIIQQARPALDKASASTPRDASAHSSHLGWSGLRHHSSDSNTSYDPAQQHSFYHPPGPMCDSEESDYESDPHQRFNTDEEDMDDKREQLHSEFKRLSIDFLPVNVESPMTDSNDDTHMTQWVERVTPQGRTYYCNLATQESTWHFEDIDPLTGRLKVNKESATRPVSKQKDKRTSHSAKTEPLSWKKLSLDIAQAVHGLHACAQQGNYNTLGENAGRVVESVRMMLYSSRSMDKDASHMQDRGLRDPHRAVMASLSKLVLSIKMVPEYTHPIASELIQKIQRDANDLLVAVRVFIDLCQERQLTVEHISPRLLHDVPGSGVLLENDGDISPKAPLEDRKPKQVAQEVMQKAKYPLNQDLTVSLQTHANQIYGSTDALSRAVAFIVSTEESPEVVRDHEKERSNSVLLFRNLSIQVGQYLGILEDIDLINIDSSQILSLPEYRVHKQNLYNATGRLFGAIQLLTDSQADIAKSVVSIENSIRLVEDTIENIFTSVDEMVEQRKLWLMRGGSEKDKLDPLASPDYGSEDGRRYESGTEAEEAERTRLKSLTLHYRPSISTSSNYKQKMIDKARKRQHGSRIADGRAGSSDDWFLGYDYAEGEIVFTKDGQLKGGTLTALVERLTLHDTLDMSFIANFLLTYRSFCTSDEFLGLLEQRYHLLAPEGLTPEELEIWTERKQKLVRLRVFNVMKNWLENYYSDEDEPILAKLEFFTDTVVRDTSPFAADQLNRLIQKRRELNANVNLKKLVPNTTSGPTSIMPKNISHIKILETDPLELARQLSIMDFKLYSSILPIECLGQAWSKDDPDTNAATNVKQSIDYCNRLTAWVTEGILVYEEPKKRVVIIKYWVQVANHCRVLNNYNTCMAILSAFDNSAVGRLKRTWELVGSRINQTLGYIRKLMGANRNFVEYREMIHSVNPPCIPFLGIYLQDLTFIEDGNPDYLKKSSNLINFAKKQKAAEVIRELKQFQTPPYTFRVIPELQEFIKSHLDNSHDIEMLYERSLKLEPRITEVQ
ncbi:ras guanine nucleotide exchange factor domain-containing protein [Spinellus fusiger]|nr:ras guanine nucleotide exchange factor domain-containing protein [Spinellus fusiger]